MAATVQSSVSNKNTAQIDGRFYVTEVFTLSNGRVVQGIFLADPSIDLAAHLAAASAQLLVDLASGEISNNISQISTLGSLATPSVVYSTIAANVAAIRAAYQSATQTQAIMIADYFNSLPAATVESAFGLSTAQYNNIQTNILAPAAINAAAIRAAVGQ